MSVPTRWLKIGEAADRARCGPKTVYRAVRQGQLRAARLGGRRELRFLEEWVDGWLLAAERANAPSDLGDGPQGFVITPRDTLLSSRATAG